MNLKEYQEEAIDALLKKSIKFIDSESKKTIVFESPTGSGKTIMMAEYIKELSNYESFEEKLAFIWAAPKKLHEQSKKKLVKYYKNTRSIACSFFEELNDRKINFNEILFFNWDSINSVDNIYIRENERENNLDKVIERTKERGIKIILVADESHYGLDGPATQIAVSRIDPVLTIRVSATPVINGSNKVIVDIEDVKEQGMIKQGILINEGFESTVEGDHIYSSERLSSDEVIIQESLKKRDQLETLFQERFPSKTAPINPLVLIQIPDSTPKYKNRLNEIKTLLGNKGITEENKMLGVWLSDEEANLEQIEEPDNHVRVLIFKQAIALGWDCPRSHILIMLRNINSETFMRQTLGRIMRVVNVAEGRLGGKYQKLDYAYVFTNLPKIKLDDEYAQDNTRIHEGKRKEDYIDLNLISWNRTRHREKTRLSPSFLEVFKQESKSYGLDKKINPKKMSLQGVAITQTEIDIPRDINGIEGTRVEVKNERDHQVFFQQFIEQELTKEPYFHPENRSISILKRAVYSFFDSDLNINYSEKYSTLVRIALSDGNIEHLQEVVRKSKQLYKEKVALREPETSEKTWEVPEVVRYSSAYEEKNVQKSIISPFFQLKQASALERDFIEYLEEKDNVEWWFKNGDRGSEFFSIPYEENGYEKLFYVDFLVKVYDNRIGFFETKGIKGHGGAIDSKEKIKALKKYLDLQEDRFFGGVVAQKDNGWKIYDEHGQDFDVKNDDNWILLEL